MALVACFWMLLASAIAPLVMPLTGVSTDGVAALRGALSIDRLQTDAPVFALLLTPTRWLIGPVFAGVVSDLSLAGRLASVVWPLLLVVAHNEWVVRSQTRFEDATLERSRRQAAKGDETARFRKVRRRRRQHAPFTLEPVGRPETAIVWKNLMLAHRTHLGSAVGAGAATVAVAALVVASTGLPEWLIVIMTVAGTVGLGLTPLMAGHQWRNDLRTDLLRIDVIRTWPIDGWRLFTAQVVPPAMIATLYATGAGGLLLIAGIAATNPGARGTVLLPPDLATSLGVSQLTLLWLGLATLLPVVAAVAALSATLQNLLALLWPSWIQLGQRRTGSAAHIGQGMLTGLGLLVALAVGLLPGGLLIGAWLFLQLRVAELPLIAWQLPLLGMTAVIPLAVIVWLLTRFGGVLWDHLDPSAELLGAGRAAS